MLIFYNYNFFSDLVEGGGTFYKRVCGVSDMQN